MALQQPGASSAGCSSSSASPSGLLLAILLDQRIRAEGVLRSIYLYPMALSFIVTGTAWKWILNPGLGLEHLVRQMGFAELHLRLDRHTRDVDLHRGASPVPGSPPVSSWRCSWRGCAASTIRSSRPPRSTARACRRIYTQHHHSVAAAGVLQRRHHPRAHRHQELRPGDGADRRRARFLVGPAGDLHVHLRLHRNQIGLGAASAMMMLDDRDRGHRADDVLRSCAGIVVAELARARRRPARMLIGPRDRLRAADAVRAVLPDAAVRDADHFAQDAGRDPRRQPAGAAGADHASRPGPRPGAAPAPAWIAAGSRATSGLR